MVLVTSHPRTGKSRLPVLPGALSLGLVEHKILEESFRDSPVQLSDSSGNRISREFSRQSGPLLQHIIHLFWKTFTAYTDFSFLFPSHRTPNSPWNSPFIPEFSWVTVVTVSLCSTNPDLLLPSIIFYS